MNQIFSKIHIVSKFLVAIVMALLISEVLVKDVFLSGTPTVRTDVADRLVTRTLAIVNMDTYISLFKDSDNPRPEIDPSTLVKRLADIPAKQIVKGVYAKESDDGVVTEIYYDQIQWVELPYRKTSGDVVTIRIPKGTVPPPPGLF